MSENILKLIEIEKDGDISISIKITDNTATKEKILEAFDKAATRIKTRRYIEWYSAEEGEEKERLSNLYMQQMVLIDAMEKQLEKRLAMREN